MGILSFEYGVMGSGKTHKLLGKYYSGPSSRMYLALPDMEGLGNKIEARSGYLETVDFKVSDAVKFFDLDHITDKKKKYLLIDEAQFLSEKEVHELKRISIERDIDVYCFGILTDFNGRFFSGSQELIRLSDLVTQRLMTCEECSSGPATMNCRKIPSQSLVDLDKSKYAGVCYKCWLDLSSS